MEKFNPTEALYQALKPEPPRTRTPWKLVGSHLHNADGEVMADQVRPEIGAFIVQAVNAHEELKCALLDLMEICEHRWRALPIDTPEKKRLMQAKQAIGNAEGR